jgi:single-strand DNA-binding protein
MSQSSAVMVVTGRLTRDAELKYIPAGTAVASFCIATDEKVKKGSEYVDEASFWDVKMWGKKAESVSQYLTKGKLVTVFGSVRIEKWEKDGQQHSKVVVTAENVSLLSSDKPAERADNPPPMETRKKSYNEIQMEAALALNYGRENAKPVGNATQAGSGAEFFDDIPF